MRIVLVKFLKSYFHFTPVIFRKFVRQLSKTFRSYGCLFFYVFSDELFLLHIERVFVGYLLMSSLVDFEKIS